MKKSLAIIVTLVLALGIIVGIGVSAYAAESNTITLPEFSFPNVTYKNLSDYGLPIEEFKTLFPETIEMKVENGVLYVKDIGAAEASVFCYKTSNRLYMTLVDGYWTTTVTDKDTEGSLLIELSGEQYWTVGYTDGKINRNIWFATPGNTKYIDIYLYENMVDIAYSLGDYFVINRYENGVLVNHEAKMFYDDGTFATVTYDADKNPINATVYKNGYYYLLEQGWSSSYFSYDPISAPEGYEDATLETFAELIPDDIYCDHDFKPATCTSPKTCDLCGETEGEALGHTWVDADCDTPKTCSVCSETEGEALGHTWVDATTEAPKTCESCGETEGDPLPKPEPAQPHWFVSLIMMIVSFLKKLFGFV